MDETSPSEVPETHPVSLQYRAFTALFVFGPPLAFIAAWRKRLLGLNKLNRRLFTVSYLMSGFGITAGYHRLFTHRSFKTGPVLRAVFAVLGSMAAQGSVLDWSADHRKHHNYTDEPGDPHSPHVGYKGGRLKGFVHAHFGWLFAREKASRRRYVKDLLQDPVVVAVHRQFPLIILIGDVVAPLAIGLAVTRKLRGGLQALLWGGILRVAAVHHATWSVNSACHIWGKYEWHSRGHSRNFAWLAPFALGEAWHNGHHAFPQSARHGLRWWQLDPTWYLILVLEQLGLVEDVVRVTPEDLRKKAVDLRLVPDTGPVTVAA